MFVVREGFRDRKALHQPFSAGSLAKNPRQSWA
jgi:hypothetical protein